MICCTPGFERHPAASALDLDVARVRESCLEACSQITKPCFRIYTQLYVYLYTQVLHFAKRNADWPGWVAPQGGGGCGELPHWCSLL